MKTKPILSFIKYVMNTIMANYSALKTVAAIVAFMIPFSSWAVAPARVAPTVSVVTEQVQTHQVSQSLSLIGKLEAAQSVILSPEVAGKVEQISVEANQDVKKGQLLIRLNDDKAKAAVSEAQAYLKDERRKLKEFERLVKRSAITQTELDAQKASVSIAQSRLASANASLNSLHIKAPFDGTVGFIDFSLGKMVSVGNELLTLDNLSIMQLDLQVPEHYLSLLTKGMKVQAKSNAWPNELFEGKVVGIDSRISQETLNIRVRIHFTNEQLLLKPGMLLSIQMAFPAIEAPIIPVQALEYSGTKRYVYVVDEENKVKRTEIWLGARIDNQVVIEKGLEIGQQIVVQGIVNMRDGLSVQVVNADGSSLDGGSSENKPAKSEPTTEGDR